MSFGSSRGQRCPIGFYSSGRAPWNPVFRTIPTRDQVTDGIPVNYIIRLGHRHRFAHACGRVAQTISYVLYSDLPRDRASLRKRASPTKQ